MCNAAPRMKFYENMTATDAIPWFEPPLEYIPKDLTDKDPGAVMDQARWKYPAPKSPDTPDTLLPPRDIVTKTFERRSQPSGTVVISTSPNHSAKELCNSPTSWGHDFVSVTEQLFCDMSAKRLWPVCGVKTRAGCFDRETNTMRPLDKSMLAKRGNDAVESVPKKVYRKALHWN